MTNPVLNIEVQAQVADAVRNLGKVNQSFVDMAKVNQDASGALGVFGVSLTALNSPLTAIAGGIKDSIDTTLKWGQTIDKLSRASGENATETSKMAVVLGDYGIEVDSLDKVVKTFTKNGLQFNLETIKKLAKEYQAIQDPVKRDEFAFKNFGKSGLEMNEILSKTPEELQAVGDAAMYSGKIINEQGVQAVQDFGVKTAQLNDKLDGLKLAIGGPLVNTLSSAIDGFKGVTAVSNLLGISILQKTGIITADEAAARANAAAHGDLFAVYHNVDLVAKDVNTDLYGLNSTEVAAIPIHYENATAIQQMGTNLNGLSTATAIASAAQQLANDKTKAANDLMALQEGIAGELTTQMIFNAAAVGLDADGQLELARKLGMVNETTYATIKTIQGINSDLAAHKISVDTATNAEQSLAAQIGAVHGVVGDTTAALHDMQAAMGALQDKTITITTNFINNTYGPGGPGSGSGPGGGNDATGNSGGSTWPGGASGLSMDVPSGYPNDSFYVRASSGEHVEITPPGQPGGGLTINVDARGASDPSAVEDAGYRGARRALDEAGYRSDQLYRMGTVGA